MTPTTVSRIKDALIGLLAVILACLTIRAIVERPKLAETSPVALGRSYGPVVVSTLADAWLAAAAAVEKGAPMGVARETLQSTWQAERVKVFEATVTPVFSRIVAPGREPADAEQRAAIVAAWREFARGLKEGR